LWQEAARGDAAAGGLAAGAAGLIAGVASCADAGCGPHVIVNKTAPKKKSRENRVVEECRMRSPMDAKLPEVALS
jgi:hypothetical protein